MSKYRKPWKKISNSTIASLFHVSGYHVDCPRDKDTWCKYQHNKKIGTNFYKFKGDLPVDVRTAILPICNDLTKRGNLMKCLHGMTQNVNESFNGMIWERIPKFHYVGFQILEFGVCGAIAIFNYGRKTYLDILTELNKEPGVYTTKLCGELNRRRKSLSLYKST